MPELPGQVAVITMVRRFLHTGFDDLEVLRNTHSDGGARRLCTIPYGDTDPIG